MKLICLKKKGMKLIKKAMPPNYYFQSDTNKPQGSHQILFLSPASLIEEASS
jgi:hypothetical protein